MQPFETAFTLVVHDALPGPGTITRRLIYNSEGKHSAAPVEATIVRGTESSDVVISAGRLEGADGVATGWVVTLADITRQKRIEPELRASNEDLQRFAYAVSHDLREPLRTIGSFTQLLAKRTANRRIPECEEYTAYILEGVTRMQKLIDGLLMYSRISQGPAEEAVHTDSNVVLSFALDQLRSSIESADAVITSDTLPLVHANDSRLRQVFQNLISNAIKYRVPQRRPEVHVSVRAAGEEWIFTVRDNGMGLDMMYADKIFGVFQRLHSNSQIEGAGIGLAIVKRIVEQHGGRIWVESEQGRGSTFFFTLPRVEIE